MMLLRLLLVALLYASQWVYKGADGRLVYKTLDRGDRILDFSYAGYGGGGVPLPEVPVRVRLGPSAGDNTDAIQKALDSVSKMPLIHGVRGTVLLQPGVFACERPLYIHTSGVVLRGSGNKTSVLSMTGTAHVCVIIGGKTMEQAIGAAVKIVDAYVPSGARVFAVTDASVFAVGDTIRITRPVTDAWVAFMGMDHLERDHKKETWIKGDIATERVVQKIVGNRITVDVPFSDSFDAAYTGPEGTTVQKVAITDGSSRIGLEHLGIVTAPQALSISAPHQRALTMSGVTDGWIRDLDIHNTMNSISITARRVTVEDVRITHDLPSVGSAKPADLDGSGSQLLFNRCTITGDNVFFLATGPKGTGPVVLLHCVFRGNGWIQPHQRWSTGLLVDNCQVPDGGIDFMNRGEMGSGHGWAIGWAVAWNCQAKELLNQQPPGAANWMIGCQGTHTQKPMPFTTGPLLPDGFYDAPDTPVQPASLYLAQLAERLGPAAVKVTGD
jgi:hypothetical protein